MDVDTLTFEMLEWELHRLRAEIQITEIRLKLYVREHPSAQALYDAVCSAREQLTNEQIARLRHGVTV